MFLASAGRIYSRKTAQEEFTRYVHDCEVVQTLRSAIVRLYQLPIKPINLEEFFAEFLENDATDVMEISMLRAELCYKKAEARDLMTRLEALDKQIFDLEKTPDDQNAKKRKLYDGVSYDKDASQYEVMHRFFRDLEVFSPGMLSKKNSIILKSDERKYGGEGEFGPNPNSIDWETGMIRNLEKVDSYTEFLEDMNKLDPWGIIFPHPRNDDPALRNILPPDNSELKDEKAMKEYRLNSRIALLKSKRDQGIKWNENPVQKPAFDMDDSRSLAELFHHQQQQHQQKQEQSQTATGQDNAENMNLNQSESPQKSDESSKKQDKDGENTDKNQNEKENEYHRWDADYWKQFLRDGAEIFLPELLSDNNNNPEVTEIFTKEPKLDSKSNPILNRTSQPQIQVNIMNAKTQDQSIKKNSNGLQSMKDPSPGFHFKYTNPKIDIDSESLDSFKRAAYKEKDPIHPDAILGPLEIQESLAAHQYCLHDVWTSPQFVYGPVPTKLIRPKLEEMEAYKSKQRKDRQSVEGTQQEIGSEPDVIYTDISYGDPPLLCGDSKSKSTRTYSKVSSEPRPITQKPSSNRMEKGGQLSMISRSQNNPSRKARTSKSNSNNSNKLNVTIKIKKDDEQTSASASENEEGNTDSDYSGKKSDQRSENKNPPAPAKSKKASKEKNMEKEVSKIVQGNVIIPNYDGDEPKQIPFSSKYQSDEKEGQENGPKFVGFSKSTENNNNNYNNNENPCDPQQVALFHPYPELLTIPTPHPQTKGKNKKKHTGYSTTNTTNFAKTSKSKDGLNRKKSKLRVNKYVRLFSTHYDQETIDKIQEQQDFSVFEGM